MAGLDELFVEKEVRDPNYEGWKKIYESNPDIAEMNENHAEYLERYTLEMSTSDAGEAGILGTEEANMEFVEVDDGEEVMVDDRINLMAAAPEKQPFLSSDQSATTLFMNKGGLTNYLKENAPKGEFLAYINPDEATMLKKAGGSGKLVNGIPSFEPRSSREADQKSSKSSGGDGKPNIGEISGTKTETKTETTVKNEPSFAQKKFASLTAAQKAKVGSASQGTASSQAAAEKTAKSYGTDVDNLKGAGNTKYNLSGSGMIAGSNVGATTGGGDYSGVMNKGGLMTSKKKKKKKTKGK